MGKCDLMGRIGLCILCLLVVALIPVIALTKQVAIAEGKIDAMATWTVEPKTFTYLVSGTKRFDIVLTNNGQQASWDMGDGQTLTLKEEQSMKHSYWVCLDGQEHRLYIRKLAAVGSTPDLKFYEGAVVKIQPKGKEVIQDEKENSRNPGSTNLGG